jgi:hypothetical protein
MMRRVIIMLVAVALMGSCNRSERHEGQGPALSGDEKIVSATIEELLANPAGYQDREVAISGMVTHVCRQGGQKCFVLAGDGETQLRIVTGGEIDEFDTSLEGSTVAFMGIFRIRETPGTEAGTGTGEKAAAGEHHTEEMPHAEAERSDYFIEALDFREVTP